MMKRAVSCLGFVLVLLIAQFGWAQPVTPDITGTVSSVDTAANVIVLDDGRRVQVVPGAVVLIQGRPATLTALVPGTHVIIKQGQLVGSAGSMQGVTSMQGATSGAETVTVQVPASRMTVQIPRQTVVVQQQAPQIMVQQSSPEVVMQPAPSPQVTMQGGQSAGASALPREATRPPARAESQMQAPVVQQPAGETTTTVRAPQSQVTVQVPRSRVVVEQQPPQITVQQQPPEVVVQPAPPPQVHVVPSTQSPAASPPTR